MRCSQRNPVLDQDRAAITALQNTPQNRLIALCVGSDQGDWLSPRPQSRDDEPPRRAVGCSLPVARALSCQRMSHTDSAPHPRTVRLSGIGSPLLWVPPNPNEGVETK